MTTHDPISKTHAATFWLILLGVSLLAGMLMLQARPLQFEGPAARHSGPPTGDDAARPAPTDSRPGGQNNSAAAGRPVVVLYEMNPWAMVLGSDSPSFALYDDGRVIFIAHPASGRDGYASVRLSEAELKALVASLPTRQFFELEPSYETTMVTDQPTTIIRLWDQDRLKTVSVYGGLKRTDNDRREAAPQAFIEVYEKLKGFRSERAARWVPEKVELMIWPYENAGDPLPWPRNWPDTTHPETKKRGESEGQISYSLYLSPAQYESLKRSVTAKSADALFINKRKWAFSFRFPFPGEEHWRKK